MGSPPPPPTHHGFGYASPRDVHTPFSDNSGRYSDSYGPYSDGQFADRPTSRAPSSRTTSSTNSNSNKNYLYYHLERGDDGWSTARCYEVSASQENIKKRSKSTSKSGKVLDQLDRMGKSRHDRIEILRAGLDAGETDGSCWEIVFIEVTNSKQRGSTLKVTDFNIIFRRRTGRPDPVARRQSKVGSKPSLGPRRQSKGVGAPIFQEVTPPVQPQVRAPVADANRGVKVSKDDYLHTPFANVPLFSPHGQPLDSNGPMPFANPTMPTHIPPERPMSQMLPKLQTQPETSAAAAAAIAANRARPRVLPGDTFGLNALLDDSHPGDPDGIIDVGEEPLLRQTRPGPGPRRQSSAQRSSNGGRYSGVNIETRHPGSYASNRSSWASDEGSVWHGELDEASSRTSDDTHSSHRSPVRKSYRTIQHARHSSGQHSPGSPRYRGGDTLVIPERTRRPTPVDTQKPYFGAVEQHSPRHNPCKPVVHQPLPPRPSAAPQVPPTAEYPSFFAEQDKKKEYRVDDDIREAQREQERRAREADVAQRERELERQRRAFEEQNKKNQASQPAEISTGGRKRYNYEPRDIYGGH